MNQIILPPRIGFDIRALWPETKYATSRSRRLPTILNPQRVGSEREHKLRCDKHVA